MKPFKSYKKEKWLSFYNNIDGETPEEGLTCHPSNVEHGHGHVLIQLSCCHLVTFPDLTAP